MPSYYDDLDVSFDWTGDLDLAAGDIKTTQSDSLQSLLDQIHSICASSFNDWAIYPNRGAQIDDFVGEPNTRNTAARIRERLALALVSAEVVVEDDLEIKIIPVHAHRVLVIMKIHALPTAYNNLREGQTLQTSFVYDTVEQNMFFLDKTPNLVNTGA